LYYEYYVFKVIIGEEKQKEGYCMHKKKHLSFTALREKLSKQLLEMEDNRDQGKIKYSIEVPPNFWTWYKIHHKNR